MQWYSGTGITGTSTTGTVFPNSGISYAVTGDKYINSETNNVYRCTYNGNADVARWVYETNIKGADGGYQDYVFAVGAFDLTNAQLLALDWSDAPPAVTADKPCLYMATKWID